jgi:acyl-coenzyme A thioesterase PaaI-like protein
MEVRMRNENAAVYEMPAEIGNPRFLPTYADCFVCGQQHPKGLRIRFFADAEEGVHAWFDPRPDQTGYEDVVHGGVVSALMDELTGWTVSLNNRLMSFTAELTIRFLKPVSLGRRYLASARAGQGRGRLWEADGVLRDMEGTVYARSSGRYFLLTPEQTAVVAARMTHQEGDIPVFKIGNNQ